MAQNGKTPVNWDDAVELDGFDLVNKEELVDVPFLITGVKFETGARDIAYAYVECELADGTKVEFNDSSKGIREQLENFVKNHSTGEADENGWVDLRIRAPKGLRVSVYDLPDPDPRRAAQGHTIKGRTMYISTGGKRRS